MSDGHLYLSDRGGADYACGAGRAWYDEEHQSILLLSADAQTLEQIALDTEATPNASGKVAANDRVGEEPSCRASVLYEFAAGRDESKGSSVAPMALSVKLSVDGQFLAIQTSDIEVQVIHRLTREAYWVLCKTKGGNRILADGVQWNTHSSAAGSSQDLFLVTKRGIEQYRVSPKRRSCRLHRTMSVHIHAHWYAPSHGVMLVNTGQRGNEIVPFLLHGSNVEKLPHVVFSSPVRQQDLYLAPMYDTLYAVYSDMRTSKLLLYVIGRPKVSCVRSLNLMLPPGTALQFSVVDNLLVCHSLDFNVSLFFDVQCDGNVSDPFSSPLPVSLVPPRLYGDEVARVKPTPSLGDPVSTKVSELGEQDQVPTVSVSLAFGQQHSSLKRTVSVDELGLEQSAMEEPMMPPSPTLNQSLSKSSLHLLSRAASADGNMIRSIRRQHQQEGQHQAFFSQWQFLSPNFVVRSSLVKNSNGDDSTELFHVRKLQVNIREISRSAANHREILPFLLRRGDHQLGKQLALSLVREYIVEQLPSIAGITSVLSHVQTLTPSDVEKFEIYSDRRECERDDTSESDRDIVNDNGSDVPSLSDSVSYNGSTNRTLSRTSSLASGNSDFAVSTTHKARPISGRNVRGYIHVLQPDMFQHVWCPLLQNSVVAKSGNVTIYISEYIKHLRQNGVPVDNITCVALAQAFIEAGEPQKLYQYLHYHVLSDSQELADVLIRHGNEYPSLLQVGLDMYFRLGAINSLVHTLLEIGETDRAIAISWRNQSMRGHDASTIPPAMFFDSCVRSINSRGPRNSSLYVCQKLDNLLLFLQSWDPDSLRRGHPSCPSRLAQTVAVPFPDNLVAASLRDHFRASFGFAIDG